MSTRGLDEAQRLIVEWANVEDGWLPEWWSLASISRLGNEDLAFRCLAMSLVNGVTVTAQGEGIDLVQAIDRVAVAAHAAEANIRALRVRMP